MQSLLDIGRVFTPIVWAAWLLEESGIYTDWQAGATVCDPAFGKGAFFEALSLLADKHGMPNKAEAFERVYGLEIEPDDRSHVEILLREKHGIAIPEGNLVTGDAVVHYFGRTFDCLVGNPPWVNFADLPARFKSDWSSAFLDAGLVKSRKDVLLGSSRADLAALIVKRCTDELLANEGKAAFFIPLSLLFNSGANDRFRPYPGSDHTYSIEHVWDFADESVFDGVATRCGALQIRRRAGQHFPVQTEVRSGDGWVVFQSSPSDGAAGYWVRHTIGNRPTALPEAATINRPRQGVNTCGANDILLFEKSETGYFNGLGEAADIEPDLLFPLMNNTSFGSAARHGSRERWVLLAYDRQLGRPLTELELRMFPRTYDYLRSKRPKLEARKGTLIQGMIKRGYWWGLLGVGSYSFAPWKVAWQALGKSVFRPAIVEGTWQGNQAMHAFCPCASYEEAVETLDLLSAPTVEEALIASSMGGTLNWAQPGRVAKVLGIR